MIYLFWILAALLALFVASALFDHRKRVRARKILPNILTRDWIEGRELRKKLAKHGVSLSGASFYLMMSNSGDIAEVITVHEIIDNERLLIRKFRRRFVIPADNLVKAVER